MLYIKKLLPGELEGDIDPKDYGLGVIKDEGDLSKEEVSKRVAQFYARLKERTGVVIPELEPYLARSVSS